MKISHIIFFGFTLLILSQYKTIAQDTIINFNLEKYTMPYLQRQTLQLDFNLGENTQKTNEKNAFDTSKNANTYLNSTLSATYTYYLNSQKFQVEGLIQASPAEVNFTKNKRDTTTQIFKYFSPALHYGGAMRMFFNDNYFFEIDLNAQHQFSKQEDINETPSIELEVLETTVDNSFELPVLAGWGRIERVEDARLAVYILDDLRKANLLAKYPEDKDILALGQFISLLQNERMFDSREKKIWEMQRLDSFLLAEGYLAENSITAFAIVNDNWDYANGPIREKGIQLAAGFAPHFSMHKSIWSVSNTLGEVEQKINSRIFDGLVRFAYEKPLNMYWQLSINNKLSVGKEYFKEHNTSLISDSTIKNNSWVVDNYLSASIAYYPSSRTSIRAYTGFNIINFSTADKRLEGSVDQWWNSQIYTSLGVSCNYYLSRQVQFILRPAFAHAFVKEEYEDSSSIDYRKSNSGGFSIQANLIYKFL